jgi:hypothetical protein
MTSKMISAVLAATAVLAVTLGSTGAQAATASAEARARVLRALTIANNNRPLNFGAVVATAAPFTVTISTAGVRAACATCSGTVSAAQFDITGTATEVVTIDADPSVTLLNGLGDSMSATLVESATSATLDGTGAAAFSVGGTLSVAANQAEGNYSANFTVTANYQ